MQLYNITFYNSASWCHNNFMKYAALVVNAVFLLIRDWVSVPLNTAGTGVIQALSYLLTFQLSVIVLQLSSFDLLLIPFIWCEDLPTVTLVHI